ncbi:MAG TPA: hypothetical protein VIG32_02420 [Candidatus Baltobacteraceae bacterium]
MITRESTLADVCFAASQALEARGITAILTGGSAASVYAPHAYASHDADFVLPGDEPLEDAGGALLSIGFKRDGKSRIFVHPDTSFTIDFPRGPLAVGGDYVHETATITNAETTLRLLSPVDCVRDRLAHFYHWDDFTALNAAVAVAVAYIDTIDMDLLHTWSKREDSLAKFTEFERRVALASSP